MSAAYTPPLLRRVALGLRLTRYALSICCQKTDETKHRAPPLLRLSRAEVQIRTCTLLDEIVPRLRDDPLIQLEPTLAHLLLTEVHLIIRFDKFLGFSGELSEMVRRFNPDTSAYKCLMFLHHPRQALDDYAADLQDSAWREGQGVEADAVSYLLKDEIQDELEGIISNAQTTSLGVEGKHDFIKSAQTEKISGCAWPFDDFSFHCSSSGGTRWL